MLDLHVIRGQFVGGTIGRSSTGTQVIFVTDTKFLSLYRCSLLFEDYLSNMAQFHIFGLLALQAVFAGHAVGKSKKDDAQSTHMSG